VCVYRVYGCAWGPKTTAVLGFAHCINNNNFCVPDVVSVSGQNRYDVTNNITMILHFMFYNVYIVDFGQPDISSKSFPKTSIRTCPKYCE